MKKVLWMFLAICMLLSGCASSANEQDSTDTAKPSSQSGDAAVESALRIAYYEQLVQELQQEVLALKAEIYVNRVEYETLLDDLKTDSSTSTNPPEDQAATDDKKEEITAPEASFRYRVDNGTATLTEYVGTATEVKIPATLGGYPVRAIDDRAFADRRTLTAVEIPDGVTQIGWFAFSGCVMLERVTLPASVAAICYGAFQNCKSTLTVTCAAGSYAEQYANSYGLAVNKA